MGTTPVNSLGTVDQHSQLQLFLDGPKDKFYTIIGRKKIKRQAKLDCSYGNNNKLETLHEKSLETGVHCWHSWLLHCKKKKK